MHLVVCMCVCVLVTRNSTISCFEVLFISSESCFLHLYTECQLNGNSISRDPISDQFQIFFFFCYTPHPPDSIKKAQRECSRDEFTCSDRTCIPLYRKCDQNPDCPDASDESLRECYQSEYPIRHLYLTTTRSEVRQSRFLCHAMPYCAQHKTLIRKNINVFDSTSARLDMA